MLNKTTSSLCVAALMSAAGASQAAVTITDNNSMIQASAIASVGDPFNFDTDNPPILSFSETGIPSNFGDTLTAQASATDNDGTSTANFSSTIGASVSQAGPVVTFDLVLDYDTSQFASPGTGDNDFDRANAEGSSVIELIFDLDTDYNYTFNSRIASASGSPELELRLETITGGDGFDFKFQNENGSPNASGFLPAGTGYKLIVNVDDSDNLGSADGAFANGEATLDEALFVLTPVPEPTSLALLGLGGLLVVRRRRQG